MSSFGGDSGDGRLGSRTPAATVTVEIVLDQAVDDGDPVAVCVVDRHERLPFRRQCILGEDRLDRAFRLAGSAVDAFLGLDDEDAIRFMDAIDGANIYA